jgi:hypothetical protein
MAFIDPPYNVPIEGKRPGFAVMGDACADQARSNRRTEEQVINTQPKCAR